MPQGFFTLGLGIINLSRRAKAPVGINCLPKERNAEMAIDNFGYSGVWIFMH